MKELTVDRRPSTVFDEVQRANFGELSHFIFAKLGHAIVEVVDVFEGPHRAFKHNRARRFFSKPFHVSQSEPHRR